jgi:hypothetical protein
MAMESAKQAASRPDPYQPNAPLKDTVAQPEYSLAPAQNQPCILQFAAPDGKSMWHRAKKLNKLQAKRCPITSRDS